MFVVPELIGAGALFIDEADAFLDCGDLRHPLQPHAGQRGNPILDDLSGEHASGDITQDFETHVGRRQFVEVHRGGKKLPDAGGFGGNELFAVQVADRARELVRKPRRATPTW